jgi:maltose O-acetyltransferase
VTEKEKMISGELYRADGAELTADRARAEELQRRYNGGDRAALEGLLAAVGDDTTVRAPFACDYGYNITLGDRIFVNFNCVFLDCAAITVGHGAQIGPAVQLLTADHPLDPAQRRDGLELASPIEVGENTWLGGGVLVLPGVSIGADSVIGTGSVVTRDVPAGVVAVGSPCRVIREL